MRKLSERNLPFVLFFLACFLIVSVFSFKTPQDVGPETTVPSSQKRPVPLSPTITPQEQVLSDSDVLEYPVVKVVDGDTITVLISGAKQTVRLIGVNTPETVDPRKGVECFGKQASDYAKTLLTGKPVHLVADATQQDRDRYNRILRYVYLSDGTLVNKKLIEEGYGYEYTYDEPYRFQKEFREAQNEARKYAKGLWGYGSCGG